MKELYLTPSEAADRLRCTEQTVRNYIKKGLLKSSHVYRRHLITLSSIEDFIATMQKGR